MFLRATIQTFRYIITARKRSLGQGNMFTDVCLSTGGVPGPRGSAAGGCLVKGGVCSGGCAWSRGVPGPGGVGSCPRGVGSGPRGVPDGSPGTATAAGSMHPTGMHFCFK